MNSVAAQYFDMLVKQKKVVSIFFIINHIEQIAVTSPWIELSLNVWVGSWNVGMLPYYYQTNETQVMLYPMICTRGCRMISMVITIMMSSWSAPKNADTMPSM